ncbi:MAG: 2-dehydropantoate 2-reductase [Gammaproteobacteria bacterium]|nr:2-dehydropantoate 2-reductase [Gammaproteobacteria bacterium]
MKVCIYGCGAIGSLIAARLVRGGAEVSVIARGPHLQAIRSDGLSLVSPDGGETLNVSVAASDDPNDLGEQDVVFLTLKSHMLADIADSIIPMLGTETMVVTACNGIPWWYFHGTEEFACPELASVDPGRHLWNTIGPERAIGCVVYTAASVVSPGVVRHVFGDRFAIGEPDGRRSERIQLLAELMRSGGFEIDVDMNIRVPIWIKLVANVAYNPVSLITGKALDAMIDDEATNGLLTAAMQEATVVADSLNINVPVSPEYLHTATRKLGAHKTSMLQDFEAGRSLELEPIVGAVIELAHMHGVATPSLDMIYRLAANKTSDGGKGDNSKIH